ncbi:hypothetical protein IB234_15175 [Pseudomonas sp. PDM16]|uniref:hypothetical protein n=1 Tax=Pseudomonas sp. PDM16 TaxID=2769292 RepID=UPI00177ABFFD|nr:hypothetical protein [Pseudomonas sp. PDM16]MBD9415903.1 hypothetical protein [Pseudomonas sp. PDM16]
MNRKLLWAFIGGFLTGVVAVLLVQAAPPKTWEECMVEKMDSARTNNALQILARVCRTKYPTSIAPKT